MSRFFSKEIILLFAICLGSFSQSLTYSGKFRFDSFGLQSCANSIISSDAKNMYAISGMNKLSVFTLSSSGNMSFLEVHTDGVNGVDGLQYAIRMKFSKDDKFLYIVNYYSDGICWFQRNSIDGKLTFKGVLKDQMVGVNGLYIPVDLAISPDDRFIYVVSFNDSTISWFSRDSISGQVTYTNWLKEGKLGTIGLAGATSVVVSPDGNFVYVAAEPANYVSCFQRKSSNGNLTFVSMESGDKFSNPDGPIRPSNLALTPDGKDLLVGSSGEGDLLYYKRDLLTGKLTWVNKFNFIGSNISYLYYLNDICISSNGRFIMTAGFVGYCFFSRNILKDSIYFAMQATGQDFGQPNFKITNSVAISPDNQLAYFSSDSLYYWFNIIDNASISSDNDHLNNSLLNQSLYLNNSFHFDLLGRKVRYIESNSTPIKLLISKEGNKNHTVISHNR